MKTAEEFLKESFLLVDDGKTCEAHTYLVTDQMVFFARMHVEKLLEEMDAYDAFRYESEIVKILNNIK